jgi:hypothetical protein
MTIGPDFLSTDPVVAFLRDRDPVRPLVSPGEAFLEARRNVYLPPAPLPDQKDSNKILKIAIGIGAAFIVYRTLMHREMPDTLPKDAKASSDAAWKLIRPVWLRATIPAIFQAYALGSTSRVSVDELYALAEGYAETLGEYIHSTSSDALASGIEDQLARGWNERVAWERSKEAFGLDKPQTHSYLTRIYSMKTPAGAAAEIVPAASKRAIQEMLLLRSEKIGESQAWQSVQTGRGLSWLYLEKRGLLGGDPMKQWITAEDELVCPTCAPLHGVIIPLEDRFRSNGLEFFAPGVHPNCRCQIILIQNLPKTVSKANGEDPSIIDHWSDTQARKRNGQFSLHEERDLRPKQGRWIDKDLEKELAEFGGSAPAAPSGGFQTPAPRPVAPPQRVAVKERVEQQVQAPVPVQAPVEAPVAAPVQTGDAPMVTEEQLAAYMETQVSRQAPTVGIDYISREAPVMAAPIVEAPAVEAPTVEAPVVAAPIVEAPAVVAPAPVLDDAPTPPEAPPVGPPNLELYPGQRFLEEAWAAPRRKSKDDIGIAYFDGESALLRPFVEDIEGSSTRSRSVNDAVKSFTDRHTDWVYEQKAYFSDQTALILGGRRIEADRLDAIQSMFNTYSDDLPMGAAKEYALRFARVIDDADETHKTGDRGLEYVILKTNPEDCLPKLAAYLRTVDRDIAAEVLDKTAGRKQFTTGANAPHAMPEPGPLSSDVLADIIEEKLRMRPARLSSDQVKDLVAMTSWDYDHDREEIHRSLLGNQAIREQNKNGKFTHPMVEIIHFPVGVIVDDVNYQDGVESLTGQYLMSAESPTVVDWNDPHYVPQALREALRAQIDPKILHGPRGIQVRIWQAQLDPEVYGNIFDDPWGEE